MFKHRTFKFFLPSLLAVVVVSSTAAQERGIVPVLIKDKSGNQVGLYKGSYALVIGVSSYGEYWPTLQGVRDDVRAVSDTLNSQGFKVLRVENPNYAELISKMNAFIGNYGFDPQNRLLFYFAGHGYTHKPSYATNDPEEWMGYFLASNSPDPKYDHAEFVDSSLSMQRIEELALKIESKHVLFVFDSCFSGSIFSMVRATPDDIKERTAKHVRQFITSGSADETVPDVSIFRRQFVSAIDGEADRNRDGYVTGSELGMFLEETVINLSRRTQTPQYGKLRHRRLNKGDFVFSSFEKNTPKSRIFKEEPDDFEDKMEKMMRKVFEEERLREEGERENLKEKRLRKERELVERERKLEEQKRALQELEKKERELVERERKLEQQKRAMQEEEGGREDREEERLRKEREFVERERKLEEQKRTIQELEKKERELVERERKLEGATARGLTVYGTKYQLENDPWGERIDDPLTPQDERYYCGDPGNCFFDHNDDPIVYE